MGPREANDPGLRSAAGNALCSLGLSRMAWPCWFGCGGNKRVVAIAKANGAPILRRPQSLNFPGANWILPRRHEGYSKSKRFDVATGARGGL